MNAPRHYSANYRMGTTRPSPYIRMSAPYKADHLRTYETRSSIKGVPAKWRPVYDELCRRMFERHPSALDFAFQDGRLITREFGYVGPRAEGWYEHATPESACEALGIGALERAAVKVKATRPKATEPEPRNPITVIPVIVPPPPKPKPEAHWPAWADEYLNRLVYAPKRDYAQQWLEHRLMGAPEPSDPGAEWAAKVRQRVERLAG